MDRILVRRVLISDLLAARQYLMGFPESLWPEIISGVIARTHAADKFRKRLGKYHPKWGDGTLTEGIRQNNAPAPFPNTTITSQEHMRALLLFRVLFRSKALIRHAHRSHEIWHIRDGAI